MAEPISTLLTFWRDPPVTYGLRETRQNVLALHAAAIVDPPPPLTEDVPSRDRRAAEAIAAERAGKHRAAIRIWQKLLETPGNEYDYLNWLALARNQRAAGDTAGLRETCAAVSRPPVYRPALVAVRKACRDMRGLRR